MAILTDSKHGTVCEAIDELTRQCRDSLDADEVPADKQSFVRIAECRYQLPCHSWGQPDLRNQQQRTLSCIQRASHRSKIYRRLP